MERQTMTVTLELVLEGGRMSGHVSAGGRESDFHGWTGLVGAIDALLPATSQPTEETS